MNYEIEQELRETLIKIEAHELFEDLDTRERLIYNAVSLAKYAGFRSGYRPIGLADGTVVNSDTIPEWAGYIVAYIELPTGEISYFLKKHDVDFAVYTRAEKLERIRQFLNPTQESKGWM